ncbi:MAG: glutaredoxin domain-containing protein [Candidatus Pacearchaeota archaeon]
MPKVKIYSTSTCPWCHQTKEFLRSHKVPFTNLDVGKNTKAAHEMFKKTRQMAVPVIEIGEEIIIGYDEDALKKALKIK